MKLKPVTATMGRPPKQTRYNSRRANLGSFNSRLPTTPIIIQHITGERIPNCVAQNSMLRETWPMTEIGWPTKCSRVC